MSLAINTSSTTGRTLFATLQQQAANGTLGDYWSVTAGSFAASVAIGDRKVTLTEGSTANAGSYTGGTGQLGTYTGKLLIRIHDDDLADAVYGDLTVYIQDGVQVESSLETNIDAVPALVRAELNSSPVPASNMRGTDSAFLAASWIAPDNAGIANAESDAATAAAQSTTAATQSTAAAASALSVDTKLTAGRATGLDNLDAAISTRSSHTAADVQTELTNNPVPSSNMRGTDSAFLAASWVAPDNASSLTAATQSTAAASSSATTESRLTATRAGYLDNLSAGAVATATSVAAITNSTRNKLIVATSAQIPASGSITRTIDLLIYDNDGNMEAADSLPTITAANESGTNRSTNVSVVTSLATGRYRATYTISDVHAEESIVLTATYLEGGKTQVATAVMSVVATADGGSGGFTSSDRTKLDGVFNKLPSRAYLVGTDASDGDINVDTFDGDLMAIKADISTLATSASITALPAAIQVELTSNPVPSSNMRGTDSAFLAASWVAPLNSTITAAAADAATAAAQSTTASSEASAAKVAAQSVDTKLTTARATAIDNLDVTVSSRSDFDESVNTVSLTTGHGLALASELASVRAKTDLLPSSPAASSDIPTASQIASQVDTTLTGSHGAGQWDATSDATLANQTSILATIGGISPTPPSAVLVSRQRTWTIENANENDRAPQIVTLSTGTTATLAMDFSRSLNPQTGVSTVTSAVDISGDTGTLAISDLLPSQDRTQAHFDVSGLESGKRYEILVTITTSDAQTLTGRGILRVD